MYIELKNINKSFGNFQASRNVSFGIEKGKLVALLGPSGSGKTTILRMIAGLEKQDSGDVYIDGDLVNDISVQDRDIGFVFQSYALFPYLSVYDNIAYGMKIRKKTKEEINNKVKELLNLVGLSGLEKRYPNQLSGGQRQRVAFARALAIEPRVLLLDEPFAAIDAKVRKELRRWLRDLIHKVGITSIFVTHDQDEAVEVADQIIVTNEGRVEQNGTPLEIYRNPSTPFVATFIGESVTVDDFSKIKGFEEFKGGKAVIRPEFIKIIKDDPADTKVPKYASAYQQGEVIATEFRGSYIEVTVMVNGIKLIADYQLDENLIKAGDKVKVIVHRLFIFDDNKAYVVENSVFRDIEYNI